MLSRRYFACFVSPPTDLGVILTSWVPVEVGADVADADADADVDGERVATVGEVSWNPIARGPPLHSAEEAAAAHKAPASVEVGADVADADVDGERVAPVE